VKATIVISTKNRREELFEAIRSAVAQTGDVEVVVVNDGSTDGSEHSVPELFPQVLHIAHKDSRGLIVRRNEAAALATGDILFSIDDDAVYSTPHVVEQVVAQFSDPRIAAVAIPFREPKKGNARFQSAPDDTGLWITNTFIGTAYAVRKDVFRELGGFCEALVHQGEESEFCMRLMASGRFVRLGFGDEIIHYESPKRDFSRMDFYGARNRILWVWRFTPIWYLPVQLVGTLVQSLRFAASLDREHRQFEGIRAAAVEIFRGWPRSPVPISLFLRFRRLVARPERLDVT
jgi:glycosyltransferase involved in cell wall biosynthesis